MSEIKCKTIALTGATGFVGKHVLTRLLQGGYRVNVLTRDPKRLILADRKMTVVQGNLANNQALAKLTQGADCVLHLAGIIHQKTNQGQTYQQVHLQGVKNLIAAAKQAHVKRWIQMSALGARANATSQYHQTKWAAEESLRQSPFDLTIFRPSVIHGPESALIEMIQKLWSSPFPPFIIPYFGDGFLGNAPSGLIQPVLIDDVARCLVNSIQMKPSIGETYCLGGPEKMNWPEFYSACRLGLENAKNKKILAVPAWKAKIIAKFPGAPFNQDQVIMSLENSICDIHKTEQAFDIKMTKFAESYAQYVKLKS